LEIAYKSKDKYKLVCKKSFSSVKHDDANKYPDGIIIGYNTGEFVK